MTTYTSKGLPLKATTDKIAAASEGLRQDLNAISTAADTAITAEGVRAEDAAKSYADTKDTSNRAAWAAADTTKLAEAEAYADGKFIPEWKPTTAYAAGQRVIAPNGDIVAAKVAFTSGASYVAANWNASTQDGRIGALEGAQAGIAWDKGVTAADLNTVQTSGRYTVNATNVVNQPVAAAGTLEVLWGSTTGTQRYTVRETNPRVYFRNYSSSTWSAWGKGETGVRLDAIETLNTTQNTRLTTIEGTAVFNGDARLLDVSADVEGVLFGLVDQNDKRTALEIGLDGDFTPYAAGRIAGSVGMSDVALDSGQKFVVVDADDRVVFSDSSTPTAATTAFPSLDWAHWGDSLTDNLVTGSSAWVTQLSALTGRSHFNGGWYNERHDQIAARQGGLPALVTLPGNVTASSGATTISAIINKPVLQSSSRTVHGTLAGVPGTIQEAVTDTVTFTPDVPGAYAVPAKSAFTPTNGETYRDRTVTIWSGRNNVYDTDPKLVVAAIRSMIDYLSPNVKRVMVMEVPPSTTDSNATDLLAAAMNTAVREAFPAYWLPIATWLRTDEAATAAGITFTTEDQADIAAGNTPTSFRSDQVHLNAAGCTAVAYRVYQEAQKRGWL